MEKLIAEKQFETSEIRELTDAELEVVTGGITQRAVWLTDGRSLYIAVGGIAAKVQ